MSAKSPPALGEFKKLENLFLPGNSLTGEIPPEFFTLTELKNIDLSDNAYKGKIPGGFGHLPNLEILVLKGNQYSGKIPDDILSNTKLRVFDVSSNSFSGSVPVKINEMSGLEYLAISDNVWSIGNMPDISTLNNLKYFSAWGCNFIGEIHGSVYGLGNLEILDLANNSLSGEISHEIGNLTNLELLALGENKLSGEIPAELATLTKLRTLDIANNKAVGKFPSGIIASKVYAHDNYMTGDVLKNLTENQNNFCDGASSAQYRLIGNSPIRISRTDNVNIYNHLANIGANNPNAAKKPLLPPINYEAKIINDPAGKIILSHDSAGIYIKANAEVKYSENIAVEVSIKSNDGSDYSKTAMVLTTESISGGGITADVVEIPKEEHLPYITGYSDGSFGVGKAVTREETAAMLVRVMNYKATDVFNEPFSDVLKTRWLAVNIATIRRYGIMEGYPDGRFMPAKKISRAELATILVRLSKSVVRDKTGKDYTFSDVDSSAWYYPYVKEAAEYGLITDYEDGTFKPNDQVLRTEAVTMINRMMNRNPETAKELNDLAPPFIDLKKSHWAHLQILEASVKHDHSVTINNKGELK